MSGCRNLIGLLSKRASSNRERICVGVQISGGTNTEPTPAPHRSPLNSADAAIDRGILAAWLGDDGAGIDALLAKFRDSANESGRSIDTA